jgi:hypothetical protein
MRVRIVSVVAILLAILSAGASGQTQGRVFVVLIDDASYRPSEVEGAGQLLGVLRDQVLQPADLLSIVSTGRSAPTVAGVEVDQVQIERQAQMAFKTLTDIVAQLKMVDKRTKHLLLLTSAATSAAALRSALGPPNDMTRGIASVAEAAIRAGVTIHVIDPADPASRDIVRRLN